LIAIMMMAFMVTVAFSIDIARMHLSRTELRTATDAAAKAAATTLADTTDPEQAITRGQQIAAANLVASESLLLDRGDFVFGKGQQSLTGSFEFDPDDVPLNSVRVLGRRTADSPSGPVVLFLGKMMGMEFFEPQAHATSTYIERDVVLVVDRSGSMEGEKFADLVAAIDTFVATLGETPVDEQVGLASYSEFATADVALTADLAAISAGVRAMPIGGYTSISRGIDAGGTVIRGGRGSGFVERTMIVMTDGLHNRGAEPSESAIIMAAEGVKIHTITFGADADQGRMIDVAAIGGGRHFHAETGEQLRQIYRQIALTLSTMITE
jgi:uncharacterized protein YegL